ncbi:uncharacterized protein METZ01_LOCUS257732, partial [marine metagenome]
PRRRHYRHRRSRGRPPQPAGPRAHWCGRLVARPLLYRGRRVLRRRVGSRSRPPLYCHCPARPLRVGSFPRPLEGTLSRLPRHPMGERRRIPWQLDRRGHRLRVHLLRPSRPRSPLAV